MRDAVDLEAVRVLDPYLGEFPNRWLDFYWRVRYMQIDGKIVERLTFDLEECMR
jgi:hypothetical protein